MASNICKGLSSDTGKKCNRKIGSEEQYCWQHDSQYTVKRKDIQYKTPIQHKIDNTKTDIIATNEMLEYYSQELLNAVKLEDVINLSMETSKIQSKLDGHKADLKKFYEEQKNRPRDEKKIKVKGVVKKVVEGVSPRERNDEEIRKSSERSLRSFISTQKTFEYKKNKNKKI